MRWVLVLLAVFFLMGIVQATTENFTATYGATPYRATAGTFSTMRNSPGTSVTALGKVWFDIYSTANSGEWGGNYRAGITFPTDTIPDDATITSAYIYGNSGGNYLNQFSTNPSMIIINFTPTNPTFVAADYDNTDFTIYSDNVSITSFTTNASIIWTLNSLGIANISKTGNTTFAIEKSWIIDNASPTWSATKGLEGSLRPTDYAETSMRPVLQVVYTVPTPTTTATTSPTPTTTATTAPPSSEQMSTFYTIYNGVPTRYSNETWASLRSGAGTNLYGNGENLYQTISSSTYGTGYWYFDSRPLVVIDTTTLGSGATIVNATIGAYAYGFDTQWSTPSYSWVKTTPTSYAALSKYDYNKTSFERVTDNIDGSRFDVQGTLIEWQIRSDQLTYINKTGLTPFMLESNWTIDNTPPTWVGAKEVEASIYNMNYSGGIYKPYLRVNYTSGVMVPIANFIANITTILPGGTVSFTDTSSGSPTYYNWTFENESGVYNFTNVDDKNPIQVFTDIGTYNITLSAGNSLGQNNLTIPYMILVTDAQTLFDTNTSIGKPGITVQFTDLSTSSPTTYRWYYENETSGDVLFNSSSANPAYKFDYRGRYAIKYHAYGGLLDEWSNITDCVLVGYAPVSHFYMNVTVV